MTEGLVKSLGIFTGFILGLLLIVLMFGGCARKVYIPVETSVITTDTVHRVQHIVERDTVTRIERITESRLDSVAPILDSIGRMIGYDRWHIIDRSASLEASNSRLLATIDSLKEQGQQVQTIREPYPVEKIVKTNVLHWWQKSLMWIGGAVLIAIGIAIAIWWRLRKKKSACKLIIF